MIYTSATSKLGRNLCEKVSRYFFQTLKMQEGFYVNHPRYVEMRMHHTNLYRQLILLHITNRINLNQKDKGTAYS